MEPTSPTPTPTPTPKPKSIFRFVKEPTPLTVLDTGEYYILYSDIGKKESHEYLHTITTIYGLMDIQLEKHITEYDMENVEMYQLIKDTCNHIILNGLKSLDTIIEDVKHMIHYYSIKETYNTAAKENRRPQSMFSITQTFSSLNKDTISSYKGKEFSHIDTYKDNTSPSPLDLDLVWNVNSKVAKTPSKGPSVSYEDAYEVFGQQYAYVTNLQVHPVYDMVVLYNTYYNISIVVNLTTTGLRLPLILEVLKEFNEFILVDNITVSSENEKDKDICNDLFHKKYYEDSDILSKKIKSFIELYGYNESKKKKSDAKESHLNENEKETVLSILKTDFIINDDPACRMRAGELYDIVTKYLLPDVIDGPIYRRRLQGYFMEAGLVKKRMSDGMYYYGIKHNTNITSKEYKKEKIKGYDLVELTKHYQQEAAIYP